MSEWPMVKLKELMRKTKSIDPGKYPDEEFALYSIPAYDNGIPEKIFGRDIGSSKILLKDSDVVLSKIVPHIRRTWVITDGEKQIGSSEWIVFNDDRFDPQFIANYLKSDVFHYQLLTTVAGVGGSLNRARPAAVAELKIPLPPLGEQKRIAEILGGVSKAIHAVEQQLQLVESACVNSFERKFNLEMQNGARDASSIADFIESTQYGTSKKAKEDGDIPILRMGNVTYSGKIDMTDLKYIDLDERELEKFSLKNGDLLFNRTNSVELVGKTAVFESISDQIISYAGYLVRARVNADSNPYYVSGYLNSPSGKAQLRLRAKAIVGMANINAREFLSLEIPAATKEEQEEFAHLFEKCEKIRHLLHRKLSLLQELQKSLATRAFAGLL